MSGLWFQQSLSIFTELPINEKLDHIPCSYIVIMVHKIVKVVNIVRAQSPSHIDASVELLEMETETNSIPIVISFDASIIGDELDSAIQLPNIRLVVAWHATCVL